MDSHHKKTSRTFDWSINLGHVFIVFSLFLSAAGLYAHDAGRMASIETKISYLESQNIPPRVSTLEAQVDNVREGLGDIRSLLVEIRNSLAAKADKKI